MLFTKMHGLGNDFIIIEDFEDIYTNYNHMAQKLCDRHFGVGGDGILIAKKSKVADFQMLIFNSDGSEAEMCGNGIRCIAKYLYDRHTVGKGRILVETLDGIKDINIENESGKASKITVNMGTPQFKHDSIPINIKKESIINEPIYIDDKEYKITSMLLGVPHTIIFVDNLDSVDVKNIGRLVENNKLFPKKTNVNFVHVINNEEFNVVTWERGAGLTLACGTGTCAALVACALNKKTYKKAVAHLGGGDLFIEWNDDGNVYMTGEAQEVFKGEFLLNI